MYEMKTVLPAAILLLAPGFRMYRVNSETKVGHNSHVKSESPCETSTGSIVWTVASAII